MIRRRFSTLIWCLVCGIVVCTFLPSLLVERESRFDSQREPFVALVKYWQIHFGEERPAEGEWETFTAETRESLSGYRGTVWLQRPLPELPWRNPYLVFSNMGRFEVYLDDRMSYSFNMDGALRYFNSNRVMHPVPVSPQDEGKTLLIRTEWDGLPLVGNDMALAGEPDQIFYALMMVEMNFFIYSVLSLAIGIAGSVLFVRRKEALYGWFTLFGLSMGLTLLLICRLPQWFVDLKEAYYWKELLSPIAVWASVGIYVNALGVPKGKAVRAVHALNALNVVACLVAALTSPSLFLSWSGLGNAVSALIGFVVVTFFLFRSSPATDHQDMGRRWIIRGYWTFTLCGIAYLTMWLVPGLLTDWLNSRTYLYRIIEGLTPNSLFLFMICMVMVIVGRVRRVHQESERNASELWEKNKELEQFHRNLERLVERRTAELEQANRTLSVTLREKAETLAHLSVLEERNRIAYEMHDVVGHTLTAAIVQLEATKRLSGADGSVPQEKLDLLDELVRKGLNDIRSTVRLLASGEEETLPLPALLDELIRFAEDTMEIAVEEKIQLPAGFTLGKLADNVLYHALQEGLTNGIRHGGSSRFRFVLRVEEQALVFLLISDGEPFSASEPGFGLASMRERVELLDGEMTIRAGAAADGSPSGCELRIRLALDGTLKDNG